MPTLTGTATGASAASEAYVFATRLPLTRRRSTVRFLRDAAALRRQLDGLIDQPDSGLFWYALRADPLRNVYTTASAWCDESAMRAFATSEPHRSIMARHRAAMAMPAFVAFTCAGGELPLAWDEVDRRLAATDGTVRVTTRE